MYPPIIEPMNMPIHGAFDFSIGLILALLVYE